ncbi:MAG: hypothetical protein IKX30_04240 [Victivallales bacterium]|nr:hypothetical protein [Victivallales bacterium]
MLASNPGLKSRFNRYINFSDYTADELYQIFASMCEKQQMKYGNDVKDMLKYYFKEVAEHHADVFANARGVRNIFEKIIINQSNRLASMASPFKQELSTILHDDVSSVLFE